MPTINIGKTKKLLIGFLLKLVLSSICSFAVICALFSMLFLKIDLSLDYVPYAMIIVDFICAFLIAKISLIGIRNNKLVMGLISVLPIMIISVVNFCIAGDSAWMLLIKLVLIPTAAMLAAMGKNKIKVK